ncbi:MAG: aspartate kinase [Bacteroidales bacterium]|nr:aspartate kinase [Bacteroidales bacterium]
MKVFKFGGASVKDAAGVKNLQHILDLYAGEQLVVVISAIGKTTNHMEKLLDAYLADSDTVWALFDELKQKHYTIAQELTADAKVITDKLDEQLNALANILSTRHSEQYDYEYDRIVCYGELLSTTLISTYLNMVGKKNQWIDARTIIRTDSTYREAKVDWDASEGSIQVAIARCMMDNPIAITQGFIGGNMLNLSTTLGREGSDYSAAIIAYSLNAESVTIWKDVPGLLNADPKYYADAVKLDHIPYDEAIELSYYGASIIHPKTLKPLQNKSIPLYVKSFCEPETEGSLISDHAPGKLTPSYIFKRNQILISIFPKDFAFIDTDNLCEIFGILSSNRLKINLMQNSALSFSICIDNQPRVTKAIELLSQKYKIKYNEKVELITIRHYTNKLADKVVNGREILVEQRNRTTLQLIVKNDEA